MKNLTLTERGKIRALCFIFAGVMILGGFTAMGWQKANDYQRFIEYTYQRSFLQLVSSVEAVDTSLQKGQYSTSPAMLTQLAGEINRQASTAQALLAQLPFSFEELEKTAVFLSRAGDYAAALSRKLTAGQTITDEEKAALKSLGISARIIAQELSDLQTIINERNMQIGATVEAESRASEAEGRETTFGDTFRSMENSFQDLPALIYDGPYSEHLEKKTAVMLEGQQDIGMESALEKAKTLLGLTDGQLEFSHESEAGKIPAYSFTGRLNGGELTADISKQGGFLVTMTNSRVQTSSQMTVEECITKAEAFLKKCGYTSMTTSYWEDIGSVLLINFAYQQGDVICYPDLVKVGVARDTGEIIQVEARGYLMNHRVRHELKPVTYTAEQARTAVTPDLTFQSSRLCLIPSPGENEILCHELTTMSQDGTHVLLYINAETGMEENILILIENENGTLAV